MTTIQSYGETLRDMYAAPGTRLKQWVVDYRREDKWKRETCPVVYIPAHDDNTAAPCRNDGQVRWMDLAHDCCGFCNDARDKTADRADIVAWKVELAARPPIEPDRSKLSDEIEPHYELRAHPILGMLKRGEK